MARRAKRLEKKLVTRSGLEVRIYNNDTGGRGKTIHGAVLKGKVWEVCSWFTDGNYLESGKEHELDLISNIILKEGKEYQAASGFLARVCAVDKEKDRAVGAVKDPTEGWVPRVWDQRGNPKPPYSEVNEIVGPWKE